MYKDDRPPVVVEIDDETDADMVAVLHDWVVPIGIDMVNIGVSLALYNDLRKTSLPKFNRKITLTLMFSLSLGPGCSRLARVAPSQCFSVRK